MSEELTNNLIRAGNALSLAAQTTGGTAGRDDDLVRAIDGWSQACSAYYDAVQRATPSPDSAAGEVERLRKALRMLMDAFNEVNLLGPNDGHTLKRVGVAQVRATAALAQRAQEGR